MDAATQQQQAMHILAVMIPMILMFWVVGAAIVIIPFWQIYKKSGMSPGLSFLMIIPLVNLVMLYVLGFSEWKVVPAAHAAYPPQFPPMGYPPAYPPQAPPAAYPPHEPPPAA